MISIAALITCHNRRAKTLACLEALYSQALSPSNTLSTYLVDDGSSDGTAEAVRANFPEVKLFKGTGNLFWNGGMRMALAEAFKADYDYYLWLNDDTTLYSDALERLLETSTKLGKRAIIVGSTRDPESSLHTYGGLVRTSLWHPLKFGLLAPGKAPRRAETMNGNCVLISREIAGLVGNLDPAFSHSIGDIDYGLRALRKGLSIWVAPGFIGTCRLNPEEGTWEDDNLSLAARWQKVRQPKGLPLNEWKVLARREAGPLWPMYWLMPYTRLTLRALLKREARA